jgi:hypothetical protein
MKIFGVVATLLLLASLASAGSVSATGEGWCDNHSFCNNTNTSALANTFAGSQGFLYQDWFAFTLPSSPISSATISIWNDAQNHNTDASAVYNLYAATAFSYGGLATGPSLGSISVSAADTGVSEYITITLNAAGLAVLNAHLGTTFIFGGAGGMNPALVSQIFGYTFGTPDAYLTYNTAAVTPEPASLLMLGSGLVGMASLLRRKLLL